jgi:hypothetical protein
MKTKAILSCIIVALCALTQRTWAGGQACCLPDGTCVNTSQADCTNRGGVWYDTLVCGDAGVNCGSICCRVTGGGVDTSGGDWTGCDGHSGKGNTVNRYTFGGQAGAPTASQPQPFGEWTHHQQSGPAGDFVFHAGTASAPPETKVEHINCSDPGPCQPANPGPCKQIDFDGLGMFHNIRSAQITSAGAVADVTIHFFQVHIEDLGEPGHNGQQHPAGGMCPAGGSAGATADCRCPDFYRIRIHQTDDPSSPVIYEVFGYLDAGNLQMHPCIQ